MAVGAQTTYGELADLLDNFSLIVREVRRQRRVSLRQAQRESGASFGAIDRLENGKDVSMENITRLLRWLDTEPTR